MSSKDSSRKRPKRANGRGSLYPYKGGRWRVAFLMPDGKRKSAIVKTKRAGEEWLDEMRRLSNEMKKMKLDQRNAVPTLQEYLSEWLKRRQPTLKGSTLLSYKETIAKIINPRIGHLKLTDIKPETIQWVYDQFQQEKRRDRMAFAIKQVLNAALNEAVRQGLLSDNPVPKTRIKHPQVKQAKVTLWTDEQVDRLLTTIVGQKYEYLIRLALMTGMRQGELLGLKWEDVDLNQGIIRVRHSLQKAVVDEKLRFTIGIPKTPSSIRQISIGSAGMSVLRKQYEKVRLLRQLAGDRWVENDLVFPSSFGTPINPSNLLHEFKEYIRQADIPMAPFHYLRHHAASLMARNGASVIAVAGILGHSNSWITQKTYTHFFDKEARQTSQRMGELFAIPEEQSDEKELAQETVAHTLHTAREIQS